MKDTSKSSGVREKKKQSSKREDEKPTSNDEGKKTKSSSGRKSSRHLGRDTNSSPPTSPTRAPKSSKKGAEGAPTSTKKRRDHDDDKDRKKTLNKDKKSTTGDAKKASSKKNEVADAKKKSTKGDKKNVEGKKDTLKNEKTKEKEKKKEKDADKERKSDKKRKKKDKKDDTKAKKDKNDTKVGEKTLQESTTKGDAVKKKKVLVCCICKDKSIKDDLAGGLCDHVFCTPCLEHLLHQPMLDPRADDNHLSAPTMGRCPECRAALKKFDMKDMAPGRKKKGVSLSGSQKFEACKITDLTQTPISGLVFQPDDDSRQMGSFYFDSGDDKKTKKIRPRLDFTKAIAQNREAWLMNDGTTIPEQKYFEKGCFYSESTRTFHGTIKWDPVTFLGSHQWDCIVGFNKAFSAIHVGVIHERKERILDQKTQEKADKTKEKNFHRYQYPFDGRWKLLWKNTEGKDQTGSITVQNNEFQQGPYLFNLNFKDPETPRFRWPLDPVYAAVKRGGSLKKKPTGPEIGERVVWETTHPAFSEITWERESVGDLPIASTTHFGSGDHAYSVWSSIAEEIRKVENVESDGNEEISNKEEEDDSGEIEEDSEKDDESDAGSSSSSDSSESDDDNDDDDEADSSESSSS